ncbi:MAG: uroporphyrinogen-III C-methyltransferase [Hyphomicrobium sp.]|nr:uroporphyrinogen-III C-methyltransferase [Hyphomicrobium sp.]
MKLPGRVYLVGAGPGDPDLLTVKAARLLAGAEAIVYDRLVSREILAMAGPKALLFPVGKSPKKHPVPQEEINRLLITLAAAGYMTVRLKGGDPFIFGRGSEELLAIKRVGLRCDIVPGITAAQGCAASVAVPLTHRGLATSVRLITGHCREDQPLDLDWKGLADPATTLVVYMGAANIAEITSRLAYEGLAQKTPVLAINNGTTPRERRLLSDLSSIAADIKKADFQGPVLFFIGEVVSLYAAAGINPLLREVIPSAAEHNAVPVHA